MMYVLYLEIPYFRIWTHTRRCRLHIAWYAGSNWCLQAYNTLRAAQSATHPCMPLHINFKFDPCPCLERWQSVRRGGLNFQHDQKELNATFRLFLQHPKRPTWGLSCNRMVLATTASYRSYFGRHKPSPEFTRPQQNVYCNVVLSGEETPNKLENGVQSFGCSLFWLIQRLPAPHLTPPASQHLKWQPGRPQGCKSFTEASTFYFYPRAACDA